MLLYTAENSTDEEIFLEVHMCSSTVLQCGSLLPVKGLRPTLEWIWNETTLSEQPNVCIIDSNFSCQMMSDLYMTHKALIIDLFSEFS